MVVRYLYIKKNHYRPKEDENALRSEVPYLSVIDALLYLAQFTRPDITFSVNLPAKHSSVLTKRHWNGIKPIMKYLRGKTNLGLFCSKMENNLNLVAMLMHGTFLIHIKQDHKLGICLATII